MNKHIHKQHAYTYSKSVHWIKQPIYKEKKPETLFKSDTAAMFHNGPPFFFFWFSFQNSMAAAAIKLVLIVR